METIIGNGITLFFGTGIIYLLMRLENRLTKLETKIDLLPCKNPDKCNL